MAEVLDTYDYLEQCQSWQRIINEFDSPKDKSSAVYDAMRTLKGQTFHDTRKIIVGGETALYLPDGTSGLEEQIWPQVQFGEVKTSGWLGKLHSVKLRDEVFLTWAIYDPCVLGPTEDEFIKPTDNSSTNDEMFRLPLDTPLRRPLHFPVGLINYAMCYSK